MDTLSTKYRVLQGTAECNTEILIILDDIRKIQYIVAYLFVALVALLLLISAFCCITTAAKKIDTEIEIKRRVAELNPLGIRNIDEIPIADVVRVDVRPSH